MLDRIFLCQKKKKKKNWIVAMATGSHPLRGPNYESKKVKFFIFVTQGLRDGCLPLSQMDY